MVIMIKFAKLITPYSVNSKFCFALQILSSPRNRISGNRELCILTFHSTHYNFNSHFTSFDIRDGADCMLRKGRCSSANIKGNSDALIVPSLFYCCVYMRYCTFCSSSKDIKCG